MARKKTQAEIEAAFQLKHGVRAGSAFMKEKPSIGVPEQLQQRRQVASKELSIAKSEQDQKKAPDSGDKLQASIKGAQELTTSQGSTEGSTSSVAGGLEGGLQGAGAGAGIGASFGGHVGAAYGAAIGGTIGVAKGIAGAAARRKEKAAKARADSILAIANIEDRKTQRINNALQNMRQAFSSALRVRNVSLGGR